MAGDTLTLDGKREKQSLLFEGPQFALIFYRAESLHNFLPGTRGVAEPRQKPGASGHTAFTPPRSSNPLVPDISSHLLRCSPSDLNPHV